MPEPIVRIGQIVGAHGLRGEVKIAPLTDFVTRFAKGERLLLQGVWRTIEVSREHKGRPLLKLEGIDDISTAERLQWEYVEAEGPPPAAEDEFRIEDLIGLAVYDQEGRLIGEVDNVLALPAQDVLQIGSTLIPLIKEFVESIDFEAERIDVRLIPGMMPDQNEDQA
ncbi:MAG: 16S rRNA processing protein RimM [Armatimonadota bacterium]